MLEKCENLQWHSTTTVGITGSGQNGVWKTGMGTLPLFISRLQSEATLVGNFLSQNDMRKVGLVNHNKRANEVLQDSCQNLRVETARKLLRKIPRKLERHRFAQKRTGFTSKSPGMAEVGQTSAAAQILEMLI